MLMPGRKITQRHTLHLPHTYRIDPEIQNACSDSSVFFFTAVDFLNIFHKDLKVSIKEGKEIEKFP